MRSGARNIHTTFSAASLTHFAGVYLFHQFLQQIRFRSYLSHRVRYQQRNNRYSASEILLAFIYPMILGLERIEVSSLLQTNGVFQYLTGLPSFPNPSTLRRFLLRASPEILQALQKAHNDLRAHFLEQPRGHSTYWIDFDSTAKTLYGHQEGALKGYNPGHRGKRSYHPLVATEAHYGDCLGGFLRYGNVHTAENVIPLLKEVVSVLPKHDRLRVRADAGFYDGAFISELEKMRIGFAVVAHMTRPIKHRVAALRYRYVNRNFAASEFRYQPHGWSRPYRFVVLRRKLDEENDEELSLFTLKRYAYSVIVTNLDLTA